ncbi:MAG: hypothetical protein AAGA48_04560 [Myxococcota bacterium]
MSEAELTTLQAIMVEEDDLDLFPERVVNLHQEGKGMRARAELKKHLKTVRDPARQKRIRRYLDLRRLWTSPLTKAPSMFTFNGIGTRLYGSAEKGEDGTSIGTLWFTFLYLPVIPLGSYLVAPSEDDGWYFLAKTPNPGWVRIPLFLWGAVATMVLGSIGWGLFDSSTRADVVFYNGFSRPVVLDTVDHSWTLEPKTHQEVRLAARSTLITATFPGESAPFEEVRLDLGAGTWKDTIYNVGARQLLVIDHINYGPLTPPDDEPLFGRVNQVESVDYVFREPPDSKSVSEGDTIINSHLSAITEESPSRLIVYLFENAGPEAAMAYAVSAAYDGVTDRQVLSVAMGVLTPERTPADVCASWLTGPFETVERHRFCQDAQGRDTAVQDAYVARAEANPDSAMDAYLAGRITEGEVSTRWLAESLSRDPDYARAHYAMAFDELLRGDNLESAEQHIRRAFELDETLASEGADLFVCILKHRKHSGTAIADQLPDVDPSLFTMADMLRLHDDPSGLEAEWTRLTEALALDEPNADSANLFANVALVAGDLERLRSASASGGGLELFVALSDGATEADRAWATPKGERLNGPGEVLDFLHNEQEGRDTAEALPQLTETHPKLAAFLRTEREPTLEAIRAQLREVNMTIHGAVWFVYFRRTGNPEFGRLAKLWSMPQSLPSFEVGG